MRRKHRCLLVRGFGAETAAGAGLSSGGRQFFTRKKKFAELRNHQGFTAELIFEACGALRGENAHAVIDIEADGDIARFFGDGNRRGHHEWSEDVQLRGIGELHVDAAEIQRDGVDRVRFQQRKFGWAAYINDAAAGQIQARVAGMDCEDAAAADKKTGAAGNWRAERAAFKGNVIAGESSDRAGRPVFLSVQRWRGGGDSGEYCDERKNCYRITAGDALAPGSFLETGKVAQSSLAAMHRRRRR